VKEEHNRLSAILVVAWILVACRVGTSAVKEQASAGLIPVKDVNSTITLVPLQGHRQPDAYGGFTFEVENWSDKIIIFPAAIGSRGYLFDEASQRWIEVPNTVQCPDVELGLGARAKDSPYVNSVDYKPEMSLIKAPVILRVVVEGTQLRDDLTEGDKVLAYIDITMKP
jgi:hypothetical protein